MRVKSLVVGYVFALALLLFAQRHPSPAKPSGFHTVIDLTFPGDSRLLRGDTNSGRLQSIAYSSHPRITQNAETRIDAPAKFAAGLWTVDQIPPERLVASLVVLDVRNSVKMYPDYQVSVGDISNWEARHGEIPLGSVVMALTDSKATVAHSPGYSPDAAKFLIEGREAVGLGIDSQSVDSGSSKDVHAYALSRSAYLLENVANLDLAPAVGGMVMIAPPKLRDRTNAPVRILALAK
jgi:kynurenine formamidase